MSLARAHYGSSHDIRQSILNFRPLPATMMETIAHRPTIPFDTTNPAVQEYLSLVRLQVLTPIALLVNVAAVAVCTFVVHPTIPEVWRAHPTPLTPNAHVIGAYVAVLYLMQLGYCLLLVTVSTAETKKALTKDVGYSLIIANISMAIWAVLWVMGFFIAATVFQGIILLALVYSNISLFVYHPSKSSRVIDVVLIHAPLRFFLILPLNILFALSLFVSINFNVENPDQPPNGQVHNDSSTLHMLQSPESVHSMVAFGILLGVNVIELVAIIIQHDVVLCLAATWTAVSIWTATPKPPIVYVTSIVLTVLHPLGLLGSIGWHWYSQTHQERAVQLSGEDDAGLYGTHQSPVAPSTQAGGQAQGPREVPTVVGVNGEATWA